MVDAVSAKPFVESVEMGQFRVVWDRYRHERSSAHSPMESTERMVREIRGSIYTLLALFELISLTSYLKLDTLNVLQGHLDQIANLGGIVGAVVSEASLGTFGIVGYSSTILTLWLALAAFRGIPLRENFARIIGTTLGTILGAISCQLLTSDPFPQGSLWDGGWLGQKLGFWLHSYFNTSGSLVLIAGGFVVTFILTTGFSITSVFEAVFADDEDSDDEITPRAKVASPVTKAAQGAVAPAPIKKPKKSRKRSNDTDGDSADDGQTAPDAVTGSAILDATLDENGEPLEAGPPPDPDAFQELVLFDGSYSLPTTRLLKSDDGGARKLSRGEMKDTARKLCEHMLSFQITGEVVSISQGPVLTTYEFKPSAGVKLSRIAALQDDLGVVLGTRELRIIAPIPGKTVVGIEVPRPSRETISLKDVLSEKEFHDKKNRIPIALGKLTDGTPVFADLAQMPHALIAGATGSGKSVFINCLIASLLYRLGPDELRLILVDPKMLELNVFDGIPHLVTPVITDNDVAFNALQWCAQEMDRRYYLMAESGSKNIDSYNSKKRSNRLPYIVVVVDELADLMLSGGEAVEIAITRLAQKARAAGIHLIIATQRPSTDVVTGLIKANIPSRISFKVPSGIDSRTVLDTGGAEELIGRGDCLMIQPGVPIRRLHACFVSEDELQRLVKHIRGGRDHSKLYIQFSGKKSSD